MNFTWTTFACNAGGQMTLKQVMPGKSIFRASVSWPGEKTVVGKISTSVVGAMENLETALDEDATKTCGKIPLEPNAL